MLWRDLKVFQIFGANTDVGKTVVSTLLCRALQRRAPANGLLYIKPVSTGPIKEADDRHITKYVPGIQSKCIAQFQEPVSPHLAARSQEVSGSVPTSDNSIITQVRSLLSQHAGEGGRFALLETAGGILSPSPSGSLQADLYRPLRLPVVLVGDPRLGGIATTISAFESLHIRGYDVDAVVLFDEPKWGNAEYLATHFMKHEVETYAIPPPPPRQLQSQEDEAALGQYYQETSLQPLMSNVVESLNKKHFSRISKLYSMPAEAEAVVWHPFRQHQLPQDIIAIDSAYGDHFETHHAGSVDRDNVQLESSVSSLRPLAVSNSPKPLTTPLFDASASWWTQGLGHGNPDLALTAAHAAGRYGHVMFANAVHQPALDVAYTLLSMLANPRLSRIFFTDNGSTGMEVAVKMALRASASRYGWDKKDGAIGILGLSGSYHGDTIGVMNCSEPNVFNEKVDWHQPWGFWFDPPHLSLSKGRWHLSVPNGMTSGEFRIRPQFDTLTQVFDYEHRREDAAAYEEFIRLTLQRLVVEEKRRFGALIMEPVVMGAGGMIFVDPLFQRTLIQSIRQDPSLIEPSVDVDGSQPASMDEWSGLPLVADEVFTGLYRLGRASSSSFLSAQPATSTLDIDVAPDISVHAKLLTGGLLPLAITTASDSIFQTFLSEKKQDALLHGHSYTAHAVGCSVAEKSLKMIRELDKQAAWTGYKQAWINQSNKGVPADQADQKSLTAPKAPTFSFFHPSFLDQLSHHEKISGCFALGTVLAMTLKSDTGGYTSTAAASVQRNLMNDLDESGAGVHSRVLGDVLYIMTSLTTKPEAVDQLQSAVLRALAH